MYVEARQKLVAWLRRQLIGPAREGGLRMSPLDRYPTGVLHPIDPGLSGIDPASAVPEEAEPALLDDPEETPATSGKADDEPHARPARRRRYVPPSSVGFSCCVRGDVRLAITASAVVYGGDEERGEGGRFLVREYIRTPLPEHTVTWSSAAARGRIGRVDLGGARGNRRSRAASWRRRHPHRDPVQPERARPGRAAAPTGPGPDWQVVVRGAGRMRGRER